MTERMLRLDDGIREIYLSFEDGKSVVIESVDFDNTPFIEPAPPKDWTPLCKDTDLLLRFGEMELLVEQHCKRCPAHDQCSPGAQQGGK